jgi:hypothetical protein
VHCGSLTADTVSIFLERPKPVDQAPKAIIVKGVVDLNVVEVVSDRLAAHLAFKTTNLAVFLWLLKPLKRILQRIKLTRQYCEVENTAVCPAVALAGAMSKRPNRIKVRLTKPNFPLKPACLFCKG